eukprot:4930091-Alexandrium_andersonii.AAC.1
MLPVAVSSASPLAHLTRPPPPIHSLFAQVAHSLTYPFTRSFSGSLRTSFDSRPPPPVARRSRRSAPPLHLPVRTHGPPRRGPHRPP